MLLLLIFSLFYFVFCLLLLRLYILLSFTICFFLHHPSLPTLSFFFAISLFLAFIFINLFHLFSFLLPSSFIFLSLAFIFLDLFYLFLLLLPSSIFLSLVSLSLNFFSFLLPSSSPSPSSPQISLTFPPLSPPFVINVASHHRPNNAFSPLPPPLARVNLWV